MAFEMNHGPDDSVYVEADEVETYAWDQSPFDESTEMDLAADMLEVTNEAELEHILHKLIQKSGQAIGKLVTSPTGSALGGILKGAARKALPILGSGIGDALGGRTGAGMGEHLAVEAGRVFGLELEGLSPEDQEFETARRFVRFAGTAVQNAALAPSRKPPANVAKDATIAAGLRLAPGLIRKAPDSRMMPGSVRKKNGRWRRQGNNIVVENVFQ